jgi:hypothetical protein
MGGWERPRPMGGRRSCWTCRPYLARPYLARLGLDPGVLLDHQAGLWRFVD